jgi:predicted nucleic acid-binding protein
LNANNTVPEVLLSDRIAVDTGLLVDFFTKGSLGGYVAEQIIENESITEILVHDYLITELYYIICRQKGPSKAQEVIEELLGFATVVSSENIRLIAGTIKCERNLALADCFSCSIAKKYDIPVFFREEAEIKSEIARKPFGFRLVMIPIQDAGKLSIAPP